MTYPVPQPKKPATPGKPLTASAEWLALALRTADVKATKAYHIPGGVYLSGLLALADIGIPTGLGIVALSGKFYLVHPVRWLAVWLIIHLIKSGLDVYKKSKRREATGTNIANIHSSVAATVDRISNRIVSSGNGTIDIRSAEMIVIGLLARIKDYANYALPGAEQLGLRVTLAVPWKNVADLTTKYLRVWCYDRLYHESNWTALPLPAPGQKPLPGSPTSFMSQRVEIIDDISAIPLPNKFRGNYRSVLSLPVNAGGSGGKCLAVVNIDSPAPRSFKADEVVSLLYPVVAPSLNLLALVLLLLDPGANYEFGNEHKP